MGGGSGGSDARNNVCFADRCGKAITIIMIWRSEWEFD